MSETTDVAPNKLDQAHETLMEALSELVTGDDYQNLLRMASTFHRYSIGNTLFLASQGAVGVVASYKRWQTIDADDGAKCQVRRGERALRVLAPVTTTRREVDEATGEEVVLRGGATRFRIVPVFHEGQLVSPPAWPPPPERLTGTPEHFARAWNVVEGLLASEGFTLVRGPVPDHPTANGSTDWLTGLVTVRDDLDLAQAFKTLVHELGHVRLHAPASASAGGRSVKEVEAESVAFLVADMLGFDTSAYSMPYVASWAGGNINLVRGTAERSLGAARKIVEQLEDGLGMTLLVDPLRAAELAAAELSADGVESRSMPAAAAPAYSVPSAAVARAAVVKTAPSPVEAAAGASSHMANGAVGLVKYWSNIASSEPTDVGPTLPELT
jgi:antirestriction protein ArdC